MIILTLCGAISVILLLALDELFYRIWLFAPSLSNCRGTKSGQHPDDNADKTTIYKRSGFKKFNKTKKETNDRCNYPYTKREGKSAPNNKYCIFRCFRHIIIPFWLNEFKVIISKVKAGNQPNANKTIKKIIGRGINLMKKTILKIVCMYCKKGMGTKDGEGVEGTSHGICKKCWEKLFPDYPYPEESK